MRTMLRVTMPAEGGNRAVKDGTMGEVMEGVIAKLKPEATYFVVNNGMRSAMFFFDLKDASDIPAIAEPLFVHLDAQVEFQPAMNAEDLKKGLAAAVSAM